MHVTWQYREKSQQSKSEITPIEMGAGRGGGWNPKITFKYIRGRFIKVKESDSTLPHVSLILQQASLGIFSW